MTAATKTGSMAAATARSPQNSALGERNIAPPSNSGGCLNEDGILAFLEGRTSEETRGRVHRHLDECHPCWLLVQSLVGDGGVDSDGPAQVCRITTFAVGNLVANRYRIERFIGKGGMGEVYLARDELMGKAVALKTPLCTDSDDPSALRKFFDEARNADQITHPNICRVYALQQHPTTGDGLVYIPFFTMEFIDGETLAARLRRAPLPLVTARVVARQLLEGLRAAHEKGVLHLDFKSENVMLRRCSASIEAVIMDFGLSRQRDAVLRTSQYQRGVGTLPYMALEQLEGRRQLSSAVDVYAFGVVLYEMLTQSLPFREQTIGAMLIRQMRERPSPPSSLLPELSAEVDAFVMKCLHRASARRYPDAGQALAAFERIQNWKPVSIGPRRRAWVGAGVVLTVSAVLAASRYLGSRDEAVSVLASNAQPMSTPQGTISSSEGLGPRQRTADGDSAPLEVAARHDEHASPSDTRALENGPGAKTVLGPVSRPARAERSRPREQVRSSSADAARARAGSALDSTESSPPSRPKALPKGPIPLTRLIDANRRGERRPPSEVVADPKARAASVQRDGHGSRADVEPE